MASVQGQDSTTVDDILSNLLKTKQGDTLHTVITTAGHSVRKLRNFLKDKPPDALKKYEWKGVDGKQEPQQLQEIIDEDVLEELGALWPFLRFAQTMWGPIVCANEDRLDESTLKRDDFETFIEEYHSVEGWKDWYDLDASRKSEEHRKALKNLDKKDGPSPSKAGSNDSQGGSDHGSNSTNSQAGRGSQVPPSVNVPQGNNGTQGSSAAGPNAGTPGASTSAAGSGSTSGAAGGSSGQPNQSTPPPQPPPHQPPPAPPLTTTAVPPGPVPSAAAILLAELNKGIKKDINHYNKFENENHFDEFWRHLMSILRLHGLTDVAKPDFVPQGTDGERLFARQNEFVYAVLDEIMKTDAARDIVESYENSGPYNAQLALKDIKTYYSCLSSLTAEIQSENLLTSISTDKLSATSRNTPYVPRSIAFRAKMRAYNRFMKPSEKFV